MFYIQHGFGRSDRFELAAAASCCDGVILGCRSEPPERLVAGAAELREVQPDVHLLVDPQAFLYAPPFQPSPKLQKLADYPWHLRSNETYNSPTTLVRVASAALDFQYGLDVHRAISPTVQVSSFSERNAQIAISLAQASIEHHHAAGVDQPLLIGVQISASALEDGSGLDNMLTELTRLEHIGGFYLVVDHGAGSYNQSMEEFRIPSLLQVCRALGSENDFELVHGYADFRGALSRTCGATAFCTGWTQNTRRFDSGKWIEVPGMGGRQPRLRAASGPLLDSILLDDLDVISSLGFLPDLLSGVKMDQILLNADTPSEAGWEKRDSEIQHWQVLKKLDEDLNSSEDIVCDVINRINFGIELSATLRQYEPSLRIGQHLNAWSSSLGKFFDV